MGGYYDYGFFYPPSTPIEVKGGIKAQNKRGAFSATWWGKRWLAVLESFDIGSRLARGRSYARKGQVLSLAIDKGKVTAAVQGSRPTPYKVSITCKAIPAAGWRKVGERLTEDIWGAARLIAGEMPPDIEETFAAAGVPLFPARLDDLKTSCSCPDWSNPCKHIAAVYYLLAEEFDRDPFLLFRLRGMTREEFTLLLGGTPGAAGSGSKGTAAETAAGEAEAPQPLAADPRSFWTGTRLPDDLFGTVAIPAEPAPLAARLGGFPFWRGESSFSNTVGRIVSEAAPHGLGVFLADQEKAGRPAEDAAAPSAGSGPSATAVRGKPSPVTASPAASSKGTSRPQRVQSRTSMPGRQGPQRRSRGQAG